MAKKYRELRDLSEKELIHLYDQESEHVQPSLNYYLGELTRREQGKQTIILLALTIVMCIAAIISAVSPLLFNE